MSSLVPSGCAFGEAGRSTENVGFAGEPGCFTGEPAWVGGIVQSDDVSNHMN
jgi:hypothetical protein